MVSDSWDPVDYSLPGSSVHGISEARILEWVAISFTISLFKMETEPKNKYHNDVEWFMHQ